MGRPEAVWVSMRLGHTRQLQDWCVFGGGLRVVHGARGLRATVALLGYVLVLEGVPMSCYLTRRSLVATSGLCASALALAACSNDSKDPDSADADGIETVETADESTSAASSLAIVNALVQTMVAPDDVAEAIVAKDGEIVYVGDTTGAQELIDDDTRVLDLQGGFVCPGFGDGHLHMPDAALDEMFNCSLASCATNEEYLDALRTHVAAFPDRDAYFGVNFALSIYQQEDGSNPGPDKADLDAICPDKPVVVSDAARQSVWVNSKALEMGGVTKDTADPEGGYIFREEDGSPHGCLSGTAVSMISVERTYDDEQLKAGYRAFLQTCNACGLTNITDIDSRGVEGMRILHELEEAGELTARINYVLTCAAGTNPQDTLGQIQDIQQYAGKTLAAKTVKLYADGTVDAATAWVSEPYTQAVGAGEEWYAGPQRSDEDMASAVRLFDDAGIQVHIHAIGDAAIHQSVEACSAVRSAELRHTITHACAVTDEDTQLMADNDIVAALPFAWMYRDAMADLECEYLGEERALAFYPTRAMVDAGICVSGMSDGPTAPFNPLEEMETGTTRNSPYPGDEDGDSYRWPEQALSAYELLHSYTTNVAYQNFNDDLVGSVEVGKRADLVCLDTNILTCEPKQISNSKVLYTVCDGQVVYEG